MMIVNNKLKKSSRVKGKISEKQQQQQQPIKNKKPVQGGDKVGKSSAIKQHQQLEKNINLNNGDNDEEEEPFDEDVEEQEFITKKSSKSGGNKTKVAAAVPTLDKKKSPAKEQQQAKTSTKVDVVVPPAKNNAAEKNKKQPTPPSAKVRSNESKQETTSSNELKPKQPKEKQRVEVEGQNGSDQEDDGQWLTQGGSKQVSNRNRKPKGEQSSSTTTTNDQQQRKSKIPVSEKRLNESKNGEHQTRKWQKDRVDLTNPGPLLQQPPTTTTTMSSHQPPPVAVAPAPVPLQEPIEICQVLPTSTDPYTSSDQWWKNPLKTKNNTTSVNKQPYSVDDIVDWPEYVEEPFIIQVKKNNTLFKTTTINYCR